MKQPIKAALLSALIFPGAGHIASGYKKKGWVIISATLIIFGLMVSELITKANKVVLQMQESGQAIDMEAITRVSQNLVQFSDNTFLNTLFILMMVFWVFVIIDAYRISYQQDNKI
ncbi:MAG: hypothetical protein QM484_13745 [Woeseiaceae bacterium]